MPCMNFTSAGVCCTFDKSVAASAEITRLASPGAPGWMIAVPAAPEPERQAKATIAQTMSAAIRNLMGLGEPRIHRIAGADHRRAPGPRRHGPTCHAAVAA